MKNQNSLHPLCPLREALPDTKWLQSFRRKLLAWYEKHARELPWRGTVDPYKVWVSEIMLQQTTTAAVEGYYYRFLERFPDVQSLATASEVDVLRYWEGLGYYRRATQLHRAAQMIVSAHGGTFPNIFDDVLSLPGIGRYTAGAICSIAYHQRRPILEANTIRLHARLLAYPDDPTKAAGNKLLWQMAELVLPKQSVIPRSQTATHTLCSRLPLYGQMNQALMELGSLICAPKSPDCAKCPVVSLCRTAQQGLQHVIPALKTEKNFEERTEVALVIKKHGKYLMMHYPQGVRWAGLWDFPRCELNHDVQQPDFFDYCINIKHLTGYQVVLHDQLAEFRHVVTRFKITLKVFAAETVGRKNRAKYQTEWVTAKNLDDLALNTTGRKIAGMEAEGCKSLFKNHLAENVKGTLMTHETDRADQHR
ncbi:MAG: A/G-specific adenine glycosylase [Planctomycetaceae bacterium]|nr:A/G-specific adenine glycosylase [Planctomycetaceae bacterium]